METSTAGEAKGIAKRRGAGARLWMARIMSALVILFMLFDGIGKLAALAPVVDSTLALGYSQKHMLVMGILGLLATVLYAIPRTSIVGALLLTGFWGGAMAAQVRVDAPLIASILFPVYLAVLCWAALWLRDERVRKLL
ncbi:DoxX family protein [Paenibacillus cymbidii]|uniref:DoxX family protein n=1 Tax=Paenibacillus cymbidii TaxID=1639034 RepID=UPI001F19E496|nr:DoxX family protein [Paenibacillus cymbidii]